MEAEENEPTSQRTKRVRRQEILEKKKAADDIIRAASSQKDHLSSFPQYRHYRTNGWTVCVLGVWTWG